MITKNFTVTNVQEIEKKWRGNLIKTMGLVKFRFSPREINKWWQISRKQISQTSNNKREQIKMIFAWLLHVAYS